MKNAKMSDLEKEVARVAFDAIKEVSPGLIDRMRTAIKHGMDNTHLYVLAVAMGATPFMAFTIEQAALHIMNEAGEG